jgi:hypothetical protein
MKRLPLLLAVSLIANLLLGGVWWSSAKSHPTHYNEPEVQSEGQPRSVLVNRLDREDTMLTPSIW